MTFTCPLKLSLRTTQCFLLSKTNLPYPDVFFLYSVILDWQPLSILGMSSFLRFFSYCGFLNRLTVIFQLLFFQFLLSCLSSTSVSTSVCGFLFPQIFFLWSFNVSFEDLSVSTGYLLPALLNLSYLLIADPYVCLPVQKFLKFQFFKNSRIFLVMGSTHNTLNSLPCF